MIVTILWCTVGAKFKICQVKNAKNVKQRKNVHLNNEFSVYLAAYVRRGWTRSNFGDVSIQALVCILWVRSLYFYLTCKECTMALNIINTLFCLLLLLLYFSSYPNNCNECNFEQHWRPEALFKGRCLLQWLQTCE